MLPVELTACSKGKTLEKELPLNLQIFRCFEPNNLRLGAKLRMLSISENSIVLDCITNHICGKCVI